MFKDQWSMYNSSGHRKYLTKDEISKFLSSSKDFDDSTNAFCHLMAAIGCRISEALSISKYNIDNEFGFISVRSLKKRDKIIYRNIPVEHSLIEYLYGLIDLDAAGEGRFWSWSRMTAYRRVCDVMARANICGPHATPKGLRHAFGVHAVHSGVPLNLVQRWLGHADMKTTAIYASAFGPEERDIASRMWQGLAIAPSPGRVNQRGAARTVTSGVEGLLASGSW